MRKIEQQMIQAVRSCRSWNGGNTAVNAGKTDNCVTLHGHHIATVVYVLGEGYKLDISLAGWNTATTRSRLSALCHAFKPGCNGVSTKLGQASIGYSDGRRVNIDDEAWTTV